MRAEEGREGWVMEVGREGWEMEVGRYRARGMVGGRGRGTGSKIHWRHKSIFWGIFSPTVHAFLKFFDGGRG